MVTQPLLSIYIPTYNQEKYISQAFDSILNQKVDFSYEVIVIDDCSSDNTREIIKKYQEKYPDIIKPVFNTENLGFAKNSVFHIDKCSGKYIAYLAGDDFWCDNNKIQKQINIMESHPDIAFCYTNLFHYTDGNNTEGIREKEKPKQCIFDLEYYINNECFFIPSLTIVFRADAFPENIPDWLYKVYNHDWAMIFFLLEKGKAFYIDKITAMHRIHEKSVSFNVPDDDIIKSSVKLAKGLDKYFNYKYHYAFGYTHWRYRDLVIFYFQTKKYFKGTYWFLYCFFLNPKQTLNLYFLKTIYKVIFQNFISIDINKCENRTHIKT